MSDDLNDDDLERLFDDFERAWREGPPPDLRAYAAGAAGFPDQDVVLAELVKIDLEYRWRTAAGNKQPPARQAGPAQVAGGSPNLVATCDAPWQLEDYVRLLPELELSIDLLAEEYRVRHRWGDRPSMIEYERRFPMFSGSQLALLPALVDGDLISASLVAPPSDIATSNAVDETSPSAPGRAARMPPEPASFEKIGRYEVISCLGQGTYGAVYLAADPLLGRRVAIKVPTGEGRSHHARSRMLREAQLVASLRHPAIVQVFDVLESELAIVMELVEGGSLAHKLKRERLEPQQAAELVALIAEGLAAAHALRLTHRDIKPANILLDNAGRPHIADFGMAVDEAEQRRLRGEVAGTPAYMSPEQIRGETQYLDGRTDIWALGVIFYEMLVAERPFGGRNHQELSDEILHREPRPLRQALAKVPQELERICLKCLAKPVTARYSTAADVALELRRFLEASEERLPARAAAVQAESMATPQSILPADEDIFVGRDGLAGRLAELLPQSKARLVTLVGPGGMGKTRMAIRLANRLRDDFPGGVWWVDLAAATTAEQVAELVLAALQVPPDSRVPSAQQVADVVAFRPPLLLVLDNFEQAVEAAALSVGKWLEAAPKLHVLVTSRERLALRLEQVIELDCLAAPRLTPVESNTFTVKEALTYPAVELFIARARQVRPTFALSQANLLAVVEICAQLEGLPLALELAAARLSILDPPQLMTQLKQRMDVLKGARRDLPERHQTLAQAVDWSLDLLAPHELDALAQLTLLPAGFFPAAAMEWLDLSPFPDKDDPLAVIQSLREKCLLRTLDTPQGLRFSTYQAVRARVATRRTEILSPEREGCLVGRIAAALAESARQCQSQLRTALGVEMLDRLELEIDNLLPLVDQTLGKGETPLAAELALAFQDVLSARRPPGVQRTLLQKVAGTLRVPSVADRPSIPDDGTSTRFGGASVPTTADGTRSVPATLLARLHLALSEACQTLGEQPQAVDSAAQALALAEQLADPALVAAACLRQGELVRAGGDLAAAETWLRRAEGLARDHRFDGVLIPALTELGIILRKRGDLAAALALFAEATALANRLGDAASLGMISRLEGQALLQKGDLAGAEHAFAAAETIARSRQDRRALHQALTGQGAVATEQGRFEDALNYYAQGERLARQLGELRAMAVIQGNRGLVYADLGDHAKAIECYRQAEGTNRKLGNEAAVALNVGNQAISLAALGQAEAALAASQQAEAIQSRLGNRLDLAITLADRGDMLLGLNRPGEAWETLSRSLETWRSLDAGRSTAWFLALVRAACAAHRSGHAPEAQQLATEATALAQLLSLTPSHPQTRVRQCLADLAALVGTP